MVEAIDIHARKSLREHQVGGFSLIELLSVIALVAVLTALAIPAIGGLRSAGSMNNATMNIALILEQARAFAMANNTYVWVGFNENVGNGSLSVAAVAGYSGSVNDINSPSACRPIIRPQLFENLRLHSVLGIAGMEVADDVGDSTMTSFEGKAGGASVIFKNVVQFGPMGGCRIKSENSSRWVQLGVQPTNGGHRNEDNIAAVQVAGLTGQVRVFRP